MMAVIRKGKSVINWLKRSYNGRADVAFKDLVLTTNASVKKVLTNKWVVCFIVCLSTAFTGYVLFTPSVLPITFL